MPPTQRAPSQPPRSDLKPSAHLELVEPREHAPLVPQNKILARIERTTDEVTIELVVLDEHRAFVDVVRHRYDGGGGTAVRLRPRDLRVAIAALLEAQALLAVDDRPAKPARSAR